MQVKESESSLGGTNKKRQEHDSKKRSKQKKKLPGKSGSVALGLTMFPAVKSESLERAPLPKLRDPRMI
jgi:hypothetical protein